GILVSLAICTVIYIAVGLVMTGLVPYPKLGVPSPIALAVQATGLKWLAPIINIGAICGISSVILVNMLAQSRIFYSMSRDGLLPPLFAKLHARYRTPHVTTAITGCVVAIASGLFPIGILGQLVSMGTLLAFAIVCTGVLILRKTSPETPRPFRTPGMPWVPVVGTLICLYLMSGLPSPTWIRLFVWLAIGLTIYFGYGRIRAATVRGRPIAGTDVRCISPAFPETRRTRHAPIQKAIHLPPPSLAVYASLVHARNNPTESDLEPGIRRGMDRRKDQGD